MPGNKSRKSVTVLLGDPNLPDRSKPGGQFTPDDYRQVEKLREALSDIKEYDFNFWNTHGSLLEQLKHDKPEFVLNFCDTGYRNDARHELHIPALLELHDIPYSGAGPVSLGMCFDKSLVRAVASSHGVPTPAEIFLRTDDTFPEELHYPAFIKPNTGDGSLGITEKSIVKNRDDAKSLVCSLRQEFPGCDLLLQEFLQGAEYGMCIVGNPLHELTILPVLEVDYRKLDSELPRLLSYSSKVDPESPYWNDIQFCEARIDDNVHKSLINWCTLLFDRLQLRDYARFDFRADDQGTLKLMEVNPNPAWCWDGKMSHMASMAGLSHADLLRLIIESAMQRISSNQ